MQARKIAFLSGLMKARYDDCVLAVVKTSGMLEMEAMRMIFEMMGDFGISVFNVISENELQ